MQRQAADFARGLMMLVGTTALVAVVAAAQAPQQGAGQQPPPPPGTPTKPLVPVAASSLAANPDGFYGEFVTLTGTVEQALTKEVFSVDQDRTQSTGKEILVLPRRMHSTVEPNSYVTVIGEVVKFDPAELAPKAKDFIMTLPPEVAEKYKGKPAILATAVIDSASVDLARWLPPPMTPEEANFDKIMKGVQPAFAAMRKGAEGSNADLTKENAAILNKSFAEAETFLRQRGWSDATKWAQDARKMVEGIERGIASEAWDQVKSSATDLQKACAQCHNAYRLRGEDGTFYIKPKTSTN